MQETKILKAFDGKKIAVEVNSRAGNGVGVLYFHGFTSSINTHIAYGAANQWPAKGYDVWRMAICPGGEGFRDMGNLRWAQSVEDAKKVLATMRRRYKNIFIVGHSLGGTLAFTVADKKLTGVVMWDPPYDVSLENSGAVKYDHRNYLINYGDRMLITKAYGKDISQAVTYPKMTEVVVPTLLIKGPDSRYHWPMERLSVGEVLIDGADHSFHKEGMQPKLFAATLKFFKGALSEAQSR